MNKVPNCIWKENKQMWIIRYCYYDNGKRKEKVFSSKTKGNKGKEICINKYKEYMSQSLYDIYNLYLNDKINRLGINSPTVYDTKIFGKLYISKLTKDINSYKLSELQLFINNVKKQDGSDFSQKYLSKLVAEMNQFLKWSYNNYYLDEQIRGKLYVPKGHYVKEKNILSSDDITKFEELTHYHYHPYLLFLLYTGCRPGEALGLKKSDIIGNCAYIRRSVNIRHTITKGKNKNAIRIIPLCNKALSMIAIMEEKYPDSEYIFCSRNGQSFGNEQIAYNQLKLICKLNDITPISVYSLRHTFISRVQSQLNIAQLKKVVGHSSSMDTLSVYAHQTENLNKEIIDNLNNIF